MGEIASTIREEFYSVHRGNDVHLIQPSLGRGGGIIVVATIMDGHVSLYSADVLAITPDQWQQLASAAQLAAKRKEWLETLPSIEQIGGSWADTGDSESSEDQVRRIREEWE